MILYKKDHYFTDLQFPFACKPYTILPKERIEGHAHEFYELVYVQEGDAAHFLGGHVYSLQAGDLFVIEPHVEHHYIGGKFPTKVWNILFEKQLLQRDLGNLSEFSAFILFFYVAPFLRSNAEFIPHLRMTAGDSERLEANLQVLFKEMEDQPLGYQLVVKTRFIEILVHLSRVIHNSEGPYPVNEKDYSGIQLVHALLEQHYDQPYSLEQLSQLGSMSTSSLTAKFKEQFGYTIVAYKHHRQIREACRLLLETNKTVLEVSHDVGVRDLSYFHRLFRDLTGMTPNKYRRSGH